MLKAYHCERHFTAMAHYRHLLLRVPGVKFDNVAADQFQIHPPDQCGAVDLTAYAATHTGQCT
jgi:hypothetical protein